MQAQGMKRLVTDHVVESIIGAIMIGVVAGIAVILIAGALLDGSGASVGESGAAATVVDGDRAGASSLGVIHSSGELVGPGEGALWMYGGVQAGSERIVGPGDVESPVPAKPNLGTLDPELNRGIGLAGEGPFEDELFVLKTKPQFFQTTDEGPLGTN
jgi:hypothetical protein